MAQKFGRIENVAPPKALGSLVPLVRAVYHDLLRRVASRSNQGRNEGARGTIPRAPNLYEGAEKS